MLLKRTRDMLLGNEDLEPLYTLEKFPVYMGVTSQEICKDRFADMEWMISMHSGMIQLGKLVPDEILYKHSHNSGWGKVWQEHYRLFSDFIYHHSEIREGILEIGGGNGALNAIYSSVYGDVSWTIVEPSDVVPVLGCNAEYIRKKWDLQFDINGMNGKFNVLIHSHVLEHLFDLNAFMRQCSNILHIGQKMLFSVPNLKETLARKYTNAINFEHTYLITDDYIEFILPKYGFKIIHKQLYREDHSIFYATEKTGCSGYSDIDFKKIYTTNRHLFLEYISYHKELIEKINYNLSNEHRPVYLFGAHIFSQYLINFGLDTSKIKKVLDNDKLKQGKRLYGTELLVTSPKILEEEENPVVILKVATYGDEIKQDILLHINKRTEFW